MRMHPRRAGAYSSVARGVSAAMRGSGGSNGHGGALIAEDLPALFPLLALLLLFLVVIGAKSGNALSLFILPVLATALPFAIGVWIANQRDRVRARKAVKAALDALPPSPPDCLMVYHGYAFTLYFSGELGINAPEETPVTLRRREMGSMEVEFKQSNSPYGGTQGIDSLTLRATDCDGVPHSYPLLSYRVSEGSATYEKTMELAAWLQTRKYLALS